MRFCSFQQSDRAQTELYHYKNRNWHLLLPPDVRRLRVSNSEENAKMVLSSVKTGAELPKTGP